MEAPDEAERIAKAARARALLKKRQNQKKKVGGAGDSSAAAVGSPLAGLVSPSPPGSVFSGAASDAGDVPSEFGEIGSVAHERVSDNALRKNSSATSPPLKNTGVADASSLFASPIDSVTQSQLDNQQRTIQLLVSEKASLSTAFQKLESESQQAARDHTASLEEMQTEIQQLTARVTSLQDDLHDSAVARAQLTSREQEHVDRARESEREFEKLKRTLAENQARAKSYETRIRELEEEAQASDRTDVLEKSLKGTQERVEALEFQLSKSKQAHVKLKNELDASMGKLSEREASESDWISKHSSLADELSSLQSSFTALASTHEALKKIHEDASASHSNSQNELEGHRQLLITAQKDLTQANSQVQHEIANAAAAARRANEAESAQQKLQSENVELMQSLNEMRPKVVELTQDKITLTDEVDRLQRSVRVLNGTIEQLEAAVSHSRKELDGARRNFEETEARWITTQAELNRQVQDLERAYGDLEDELRNSRASVQELDAERSSHRKAVIQYEETLERLQSSSVAGEAELGDLRQLLGESQRADREVRDLLAQAQAELETLRADASAKEEEITRLKDRLAIQSEPPMPSPNGHRPRTSIGDEMLVAVQQQHAIELSEARSQIRSLQNSIYSEQSRTHALQKQIAALENELASLRFAVPPPSPFRATGATSSGLRLTRTHSAQSITSNHSNPASIRGMPSRLATVTRPGINPFDETSLPLDTRHKRKVSLSMLKARLESERGLFVPVTGLASTSPSSRSAVLAPLEEASPSGSPPLSTKDLHEADHSQFRDEAHIFWCHACSGDLVVL